MRIIQIAVRYSLTTSQGAAQVLPTPVDQQTLDNLVNSGAELVGVTESLHPGMAGPQVHVFTYHFRVKTGR